MCVLLLLLLLLLLMCGRKVEMVGTLLRSGEGLVSVARHGQELVRRYILGGGVEGGHLWRVMDKGAGWVRDSQAAAAALMDEGRGLGRGPAPGLGRGWGGERR